MTNVNRFIMKNVGRTEKNVNIDDKKTETTCRRNEKKRNASNALDIIFVMQQFKKNKS